MRVRVPLEEPLLGVDDWRVEVDVEGVEVRDVLVVRPELSVERIWVRVVPDELTRVDIVVVVAGLVGVTVVVEVLDVLEELVVLEGLVVLEVLEVLEELEGLVVLDDLEVLDEVVALVVVVDLDVLDVLVVLVELFERDGVGVADVRVVLAAAASRRSAALRTVRCVELWAAPGVLSIGVAV